MAEAEGITGKKALGEAESFGPLRGVAGCVGGQEVR